MWEIRTWNFACGPSASVLCVPAALVLCVLPLERVEKPRSSNNCASCRASEGLVTGLRNYSVSWRMKSVFNLQIVLFFEVTSEVLIIRGSYIVVRQREREQELRFRGRERETIDSSCQQFLVDSAKWATNTNYAWFERIGEHGGSWWTILCEWQKILLRGAEIFLWQPASVVGVFVGFTVFVGVSVGVFLCVWFKMRTCAILEGSRESDLAN